MAVLNSKTPEKARREVCERIIESCEKDRTLSLVQSAKNEGMNYPTVRRWMEKDFRDLYVRLINLPPRPKNTTSGQWNYGREAYSKRSLLAK